MKKKLEVFERKILRKIFGPKKNNEGEYEIQSNKNLEELYNDTNIVGILKSARIGWAGHVWRSKGLIGQITAWKPNVKRPRGRPRQRWTKIGSKECWINGKRQRSLKTILCCCGNGP